MGGSTTIDGGTCGELTELTFNDPGFESGSTNAGWAGSGNYPEYASVTSAAARTGSYGAELNDTGVGVPGIEQRISVTPELYGRTVTVTAWVRLVTFPSIRLLLESNDSGGIHLGIQLADTVPSSEWQKLTVSGTIPANTDHLMIKISSAVADGAGIAHADDVMVCLDDVCQPCAN
jgi:hypothetical protein